RRHVPRHPRLLRRAPAAREQRRDAGSASDPLPHRHQGGRDRERPRRRTAHRGRVRPQDDLLRRAPELPGARQGAAERELAMARRYKKVEAAHGHHGGAWKVAYADFVTAMMALFMVMWLLASTDEKSRKEIS